MKNTTLKQMDCDIVVLGAGGAGIVAAARGACLSNKKIIVVEKANYIGGGAAMAGDFRVYGSKWQKDRGLDDALNMDLLKVMDMTYWKLDRQLTLRSFLATGQFFDWACTLADDVAGHFAPGRYVFDLPDKGPAIPAFIGHDSSVTSGQGRSGGGSPGGGPPSMRCGTYMCKLMAEECKKRNVPVLLKHRVIDAEVTGGKISAVIVESEENVIKISCKACIIATGSWINNQKILEMASPVYAKLDPGPSVPAGHRNSNYTGDGIALAEKAGAFVDYDSFCIRPMGPSPKGPGGGPMSGSRTMESMCRVGYSLQINKAGKRYTCEPSSVRMGFFDSGHVALEQPDGVTFMVFDRNGLDAAIKKSRDNKGKGVGLFGNPFFPDDVDADLKSDKSILQANTVEELAARMGVDPAVFKATIARYNASCTAGFDDDCFKPKEDLLPLNRAPYYAAECGIGTDGAFGGVLINADMQAYKRGGGLVEGLYIIGDFASGRFVNDMGVKRQIINDLAWAFASGYIAIESAINYLNGKN